LRGEYKEFDDLVEKSKKWFPHIFPGAKFIESKGDYKWISPNGEKLYFRVAKKIADYDSYHGHGYPWIGWEELTSWPTEELYISMLSICRWAHPGMPRHYRATFNPWGVRHNRVKARFIDPMPRGVVITDEVGRERVAIHGEIWENSHLLENDPEYLKNLEAQSGAKRKAWLEGDWDIVAGGMFGDVWDAKTHIVEPFKIPQTWRIDRSFDWGSARPHSVGWTRADKRPGSRISGWELMRERLENPMAKEGPGLYVFNTCRQFIRTVPVLPRDEAKPDDIDKEAENHVADETRYRILANGNFFTEGHLT